MSTKAAKDQSLMPEKPKEDLSSKLISPVAGTVVSIDVAIGDMVYAGQSVAVVQAMKMQNGQSNKRIHRDLSRSYCCTEFDDRAT